MTAEGNAVLDPVLGVQVIDGKLVLLRGRKLLPGVLAAVKTGVNPIILFFSCFHSPVFACYAK